MMKTKRFLYLIISLTLSMSFWSCSTNNLDNSKFDAQTETGLLSFVDSATPKNVVPFIIQNSIDNKQEGLRSAPSGYVNLIFSDEFNSFDTQKWTKYSGSKNEPSNNFYFSWTPDNIVVASGHLKIIYEKHEEELDGETVIYSTAGRVDTRYLFEQKYGYFEACAHIVKPNGHQTAFWMMPQGNSTEPGGVHDGTANDGAEIDIIEGNSDLDKYSTNLHWDGYGSYHKSSWAYVTATGLFSTYWHIFGFEWAPTYLKFYYDGVVKRTITDPKILVNVKEYMILNGKWEAPGGTWDSGDITTNPNQYDYAYFDYVRVFVK